MKVLVIISMLAAAVLAAEEPNYPKAEYKPPAYTKSYDYPPMPHNFAWAVKDDPSYNDFSHQELSDGKVVSGSYRVLLPDGRVQIVTYKADENGYVASVQYEGEAKYDYKPSDYKPSYNKPAAYPAPDSYSKPTYSTTEYTTPAYTTPTYTTPVTYAKPSAYPAEKYPTRPAAYPQSSYTTPAYNPAPYKADY